MKETIGKVSRSSCLAGAWLPALLSAGLASAAAPGLIAFDPAVENPLTLKVTAGDPTEALMELRWCGVGIGGWVAKEPALKLTLDSERADVSVEGSVPFVLMLPGRKVYCSNRAGVLEHATLPAGTIEVFAVGKAAGKESMLDYGYLRGESVTLQVVQNTEPLRFKLAGVPVLKVGPEQPTQVVATFPTAGTLSLDSTSSVWGDAPVAVLELAAPLVAPSARLLWPVAPGVTREGAVVVMPLDVARARQQKTSVPPVNHAASGPKVNLAAGRYGVFASVAKGARPLRWVLAPAARSELFTATRAEDLAALDVAGVALPENVPFVTRETLSPGSPKEFERHLELWRTLPRELRVTLTQGLETKVSDRFATMDKPLTIAAGEPMLVVAAGAREVELVTLDGLFFKSPAEQVTRTLPAGSAVPSTSRRRLYDDDDTLLEFATPALKKLHASFTAADATAQACWDKNYNPAGQDYDVVTYKNGRVANVESLDVRFRAKALSACKAPLATAEKLRKQLFAALKPEAAKQRAAFYEKARAALQK